MRTIEEYMRLPYRMEIIPDTVEGGFAVRFPELPGCLTCGDTLEEAVRNAADCKKEWLIAAMEEGITYSRACFRRRILGSIQAADSQITAQVSCGAFQSRGNQHESVLSLSSGKK